MVATREAEQGERWRVEAERQRGEADRWRAEAERWRAEAGRHAADSVALRAHQAELEGQVAALHERVVTLSRLLFGDSSERQQRPKGKARRSAGGGRGRGQQPGSGGHGRRDYSHLETEEIIHDLDEDQRVCGGCGAAYVPFGDQTSEQIDWQVRIVRIVHRRRSYRRTCSCTAPGIVTAPLPPKPVAKGRFTSMFLARLMVEKYVWGRPLCRIGGALASEGFDVAQGSLVGALKACTTLLEPLDAAIRERNGAAGHLHVDETSWKVFEDLEGKDNHRWWLWVFAAADTTVFAIEPSRSTKVLRDHLGIDVDATVLEGDRRLLISSDFFTAYQALAKVEGVDALWCWAHIRRYFIRAGDAHPETLGGWRDAWVGRIAKLYVAHNTLRTCLPDSVAAGQAEAALVAALAAIDDARHTQAADAALHPAAVKVLATLDREWDGLARHTDFPEVALDNNTSERLLRGSVVGRKNFYGSGAVWAAKLAAQVWSVTATAKQAGCDALAYLHAYLEACAAAGGKPPPPQVLERMLPWAASPAQLAAWQAPHGPAP